MKEISPIEWFGNRLLTFCPPHFIKSTTPVSENNRLLWIENNLHGRYAFWFEVGHQIVNGSDMFVAFEDPGDAMLYELYWS